MSEQFIKFFEKDRFVAHSGIKLIEAKPGYAVAEMKITENHMNAANVVQGGAIFTLADFAFAAASNSYGSITLGVNANISYFKPPKGKTITAKATEVSSGRTLCCYSADVLDEDGSIIARFTATGYKKKDKISID